MRVVSEKVGPVSAHDPLEERVATLEAEVAMLKTELGL